MINLWLGSDDEFFHGLFTYLKRKFDVKLNAFTAMQNNTVPCIYHESIVALESVHEVLRKIGDSSAPTREDYNNAIKVQNDERSQAIIDFYKKLALLNEGVFDAFQNFRRHYYFDPVISHYSIFLDHYRGRDGNTNFEEFFKRAKTWHQESFGADEVFTFIESYKASLLEEQTNEVIKESIEEQNYLYENLMGSYDELVKRNINIGICVVDMVLPSSLKINEPRSDFLSIEFLAKILKHLENTFAANDAILLTINHAHVISNDHFVLSYLLIYKASTYKSSKAVFELVQRKVQKIIGTVNTNRVKIINREAMLKSLYPQEVFTGTLSSYKQKIAFREKFLRYFLSSIYLISLDESPELEHQKTLKNISLNKFIFYKEKLYRSDLALVQRLKAIEEKSKEDQQKPHLDYLSDLIDEVEVGRIDTYFNNYKGLPTAEIKELELIHYLYKQQRDRGFTDDFIKIECFLSRLLYGSTFEFNERLTREGFVSSPKLGKLSLLFQQFLQVSVMSCVREPRYRSMQLNTKAVAFISQFYKIFDDSYAINETAKLKEHLEKFKTNVLRSAVHDERQQLRKALKKEDAIRKYLAQVLKKDVVILRFIFECNVSGQAKLFDDMFRDFIDNLKRRHTEKLRLAGHVGVYIPNQLKDYIDATLLFEAEHNEATNIEALKQAVIDYWVNYVEYKQKQIHTFNVKHHKKYTGNKPNPFAALKGRRLKASSIPVVKGEYSLSNEYVEIFQGQQVAQKLFIEKASMYYAHCPVILVKPEMKEFFPRKNHLILGRIRSPHSQESSSSADTNIAQNNLDS